MLVAVTVMLLTGPVMQLSYGRSIEIFDWIAIAPPNGGNMELASLLHRIHAGTALFLFLAIVLHIGGVYKHTAFNQDGTLAKIIFPGRQSGPAAMTPTPQGEEGES
jgi:cytochrome b561